MSAPAANTPTVFVSYSHADDDWLEAFRVWLAPVIRKRRVEFWADDYIQFGDVWRREIDGALDRACLALLLVSPSFLNSSFILDEELPRLATSGVPFAAVLVRECLWEEEPLLEQVQFVYGPSEGPLAVPRTAVKDRSRELAEICRRIVRRLPDVAPNGAGASRPAAESAAVSELVTAEEPGRLDGVPARPPAFVEREELAALRAQLLGGTDIAVGLTGNPQAFGLHGDGGIGKSVLAAELARDPEVGRAFPDGRFWVTLGEEPDLVGAQVDLLARLGAPQPEVSTAPEGLGALRDVLTGRRCLLIVDDVWSAHAAHAFLATSAEGRVMYTARDPIVLETVGARVERVDVLPEATARRLLATLAGVEPAALPPAVDVILAATKRVAFALALVGAAAGRGGRSWEEVAEELAHAGDTYPDHPYADAFKAMQVGVSALSDELLASYTALAVYPEDTVIPAESVARLWQRLHGLTFAETAARLEALAERKLLAAGPDGFRFHDLQRQFILLQAGAEASVFHGELLAAYRDLLGGSPRWSALPPEEPYIWAHLMYHLYGARDRAGMASAATDLGFIVRRAFDSGRNAVEGDVRRAAALYPEHEAVQWVARFVRQWGHLLVGHDSLGDVAATVASRLDGLPAGVDASALTELIPPRHLRPLRPLPQVPGGVSRVLEPHIGYSAGLAFSPDGTLLASGDNEPLIWNVRTGDVVHRPVVPDGLSSVAGLCFSRDGRYLAGAAADYGVPSNFQERVSAILVWDLRTSEPAHVLVRDEWLEERPVVAWSPDGDRLAAAIGSAVSIWDAPAWTRVATLQEETEVTRVALSPGGCRLALATKRGGRLHDIDGGGAKRLRPGRLRFRDARIDIDALVFDGDGRLWTVAFQTVRCFDSGRGWCRSTRTIADYAFGLTFSPDGRLLYGWEGSVPVTLDLRSGLLTRARAGPSERYRSAFAPDGRMLAECAHDGYVRLWDLTASAPASLTDERVRMQVSGGFALGAPIYARAYYDDNRVELVDVATGATADGGSLPAPVTYAVAPSANAGTVAYSSRAAVVLAELSDPPRLLASHDAPDDFILVLSVSSDGDRVAWKGDRAVHVLDAAGQHWDRTEDDSPDIHGLGLAPDGRRLAYSHGDDLAGCLTVWEPDSGRAYRLPDPDAGGYASQLVFSADGRRLVVGDSGQFEVWDVDGAELLHRVDADVREVQGLALSPGGELAAVVGGIELSVWELRTGARIAVLKLGFAVRDVQWGAWGIAVAGRDGTACLELV